MNVKDLQQFLLSLKQPLSTCGAKAVSGDLERVCRGLEPFRELPVARFADFLVEAETYARTGVVPTTGRARSSAGKSAARKTDPESIRTAVDSIRSFYDRVTSPEVDYAMIDAEVKRLEKSFTKESVLEIAAGFGITTPLKTKKAALDEIRRRLNERKESHQRTQF